VKFLRVLCLVYGLAISGFALDREAFTFTRYDLEARVEPEQQRLGVRGRITLRNDSASPQKNVALHTEALIRQHAQAMYQQAVVLKLMPLSNATQITDDERALIKRWVEAGAKAD